MRGSCDRQARIGGLLSHSRHPPSAALPAPAPQALHARLEPMLYFFVDASSSIDASDPGWHLLTVVETTPDGEAQVLGFATCYRCALAALPMTAAATTPGSWA